MAKTYKKVNRKRVGKTLKIVLLGLLTLGIAGAVYSAITNRVENEIHPKFEVGALDTETGEYVKDEQKLYTPDMIEYNNLEISLAFDNNVNYQVFFYDVDGEFVSASDIQTKKFKDESEDLKYARIVITPIVEDDAETEDVNESEEFKVTLLNKRSYVNQLTIVASLNEEVEEDGLLTITVECLPSSGLDESSYVFEYEEGMTWGDWVKSEYNYLEFYVSSPESLNISGTDANFYVDVFSPIDSSLEYIIVGP